MQRWLSRVLVAGLGIGAASCQTLPEISPNVCGNLIIDPGEDCDGFIDPADARAVFGRALAFMRDSRCSHP